MVRCVTRLSIAIGRGAVYNGLTKMSVASQLYQLQELDTELEAGEQNVGRMTRELADNSTIAAAQASLDSAHQRLAEMAKQQRSLEADIADLTSKVTKIEKDLYGGKIRNPKELTDLQHEFNALKAQRMPLEEKLLDLMELVEETNLLAKGMEAEHKVLQAEKETRNKQLSAELESLKITITGLKEKRRSVAAGIDPQTVATYEAVKKQRGTAVARVEQGLCKGCRISLTVTEVQNAKKGVLARCGSCGRILYMS